MIFRNSEHYYDPTAGKAISNVMRETRGLSYQGCRPFYAENCPLDSFPGATNPPDPLRYDSLIVGTDGVTKIPYHFDKENWEDLAIAVIAAQAEDYRALRKQLRETPRMREIDRLVIEVEILGIEMFFLSDWFCMLTDVDGGMILERLKKEEDANDGKGVSAAGLSA